MELAQLSQKVHLKYVTSFYQFNCIEFPKLKLEKAKPFKKSLDIYRNTIVWQSGPDEKSNIYMSDIIKHKTIQITKSGSAIEPAIYVTLLYISAKMMSTYTINLLERQPLLQAAVVHMHPLYNEPISKVHLV